jgi:hypothetical protein
MSNTAEDLAEEDYHRFLPRSAFIRIHDAGSSMDGAGGPREGGAMSPRETHLKFAASILAFTFASLCAHAQTAKPSKDNKRTAPSSTMTCEQMSAASHGSVSVEACKQMMAAQQTFAAAASDPSASRPGDDKMTCEQIAAEMKQQPFTPPDQAKVTEAQTSLDDLQKQIDKDKAEGTALVIKETAEESLASKLLPVNAVAAAETKRIRAEQDTLNQKLAKETQPKVERSFNALGGLTEDVTKQIAANPRLAVLYQLATKKRCTAAQLK